MSAGGIIAGGQVSAGAAVVAIAGLVIVGWALGFVAERLGIGEAIGALLDDEPEPHDPRPPCRCRHCRERPSEPCSDYDGT